MQGDKLEEQPAISSQKNVLLYNGEIFNGVEVYVLNIDYFFFKDLSAEKMCDYNLSCIIMHTVV